jgi:hypothetical protein
MIKEKHNEKESTMGEQEKNAHPINIMGHVIYIFHTFLKFFSSKVNFLYCVVEAWCFLLSISNLFPFPLEGKEEATKDIELQETNQELEEEREDLEKQVEHFPSFSRLGSKR